MIIQVANDFESLPMQFLSFHGGSSLEEVVTSRDRLAHHADTADAADADDDVDAADDDVDDVDDVHLSLSL